MGTRIKAISKSLVIIILLIQGIGINKLLAEEVNTKVDADLLILKQHSLDFNKEYYGDGDGQLTFRLMLSPERGVDANQIRVWMAQGLITIDGITLNAEDAVVKNHRNLVVPFTFEQPLTGNYTEAILRISGIAQFADFETPLSLFKGLNSVVEVINPQSMESIKHQVVIPEKIRFDDQRARPHLLAYVVIPSDQGLHQTKPSFVYRNRYWLAGAASVVVSGAATLMRRGGESLTYLPEPPGRP